MLLYKGFSTMLVFQQWKETFPFQHYKFPLGTAATVNWGRGGLRAFASVLAFHTFCVLAPAVGEQREDCHSCPQPSDEPPPPSHLLSSLIACPPGQKHGREDISFMFQRALQHTPMPSCDPHTHTNTAVSLDQYFWRTRLSDFVYSK